MYRYNKINWFPRRRSSIDELYIFREWLQLGWKLSKNRPNWYGQIFFHPVDCEENLWVFLHTNQKLGTYIDIIGLKIHFDRVGAPEFRKKTRNIIFEFEYLILNWKLVKYGNIRTVLEKWNHNFWWLEKKKNLNTLKVIIISFLESLFRGVMNAGGCIINEFFPFNVEQCKLVEQLVDGWGKEANYWKFSELVTVIGYWLGFFKNICWTEKNPG